MIESIKSQSQNTFNPLDSISKTNIIKIIAIAAIVTGIAHAALAIIVASGGLAIIPITFGLSTSVTASICGGIATVFTIGGIASFILNKKTNQKINEVKLLETSEEERKILLDACYKFASKIRNEIAKEDPNKTISFSTPSILIALSMALKGLDQTDKKALLETIGLNNLSESRIHALVGNLMNTLQLDSKNAQCTISNAIVNCKSNPYSKDFTDTIKDRYDGHFFNEENGKKVAEKANAFVKTNTKGMINEIIDPNSIEEDIFAILNVVYFKGLWQEKFQKENTRSEQFTDTQGKNSNIEMLHSERDLRYYEKDGVKMVEIPYKSSNGKKLSFVALLPREGTSIESFEDKLDMDFLQHCRTSSSEDSVDLTLPKFEIESSYPDLMKYLQNLGCSFTYGIEKFPITDIIHKTKIKLDESGTEAAAATAINTVRGMMEQPEKKIFNANRPFSYMIMIDDNVLFQGSIRSSNGLNHSS